MTGVETMDMRVGLGTAALQFPVSPQRMGTREDMDMAIERNEASSAAPDRDDRVKQAAPSKQQPIPAVAPMLIDSVSPDGSIAQSRGTRYDTYT